MSRLLLAWYDRNARVFPWRNPPGQKTCGQAYAVWLSEVMLQQTTTTAVLDYYRAFMARWPDVAALAAAENEQVMAAWAGLGYYARARNLLKCARQVVSDFGGVFPDRYDALLKLPGIGSYTAAAIAAIAFDQPETVVDGNVERVMARLHDVKTPLPAAKPELKALAARLTPKERPGDYAQAVMDLGATICTPKNPACGVCPWHQQCKARARGCAGALPARTPKIAKPVRHGQVYVARRADGAWLLERRPDRGLLGGMLGWPGSPWSEDPAPATLPPCPADWQCLPAGVRHSFTHFHLHLRVNVARLGMETAPEQGHFVPAGGFRASELPTVMRKAFSIAQRALMGD